MRSSWLHGIESALGAPPGPSRCGGGKLSTLGARKASVRQRTLTRPLATGALALCACILAHSAHAAYVVDRLLVAIHEDRTPQSAIVQVVPTGSPIEVLSVDTHYAQVRTSDGVTGWVDNSYITEEKPAELRLTELQDTVSERIQALADAEARIDALHDELKAMRSQSNQANEQKLAAQVQQHAGDLKALTAELGEALQQNRLLKEEAALRELAAKQDAAAEIEALKAEVTKLERAQEHRAPTPPASQDLRELQHLAEENRRVKEKLETLKGELSERQRATATVALRTWRWRIAEATVWELGALVFTTLLAFAVGALWIDRASRKRMGGFRF